MIKHYYLPLLNAGFMNKVNIVLERRIILPVLLKASQENTVRFWMRLREDAWKMIREYRRATAKFNIAKSARFFDTAMKTRSLFLSRVPF